MKIIVSHEDHDYGDNPTMRHNYSIILSYLNFFAFSKSFGLLVSPEYHAPIGRKLKALDYCNHQLSAT